MPATEASQEWHLKPPSKTVGPFQRLWTTPDIFPLDEEGMINTFSIDGVTRAPEETNKTRKRKDKHPQEFLNLPPPYYHAVMEPTNPSMRLKGSSGMFKPMMTFDTPSVGIISRQVTLSSNLSAMSPDSL